MADKLVSRCRKCGQTFIVDRSAMHKPSDDPRVMHLQEAHKIDTIRLGDYFETTRKGRVIKAKSTKTGNLMVRHSLKVQELKELFHQTIRLISFYKEFGVPIPFTLKGNLGEFLVVLELKKQLQEFPEYKVNHKGGASRGVDITIDDDVSKHSIKIQVKTQIKHPPEKYYDYESSPTINRATIEDKKCHIIVLQILYPNNSFGKIEKINTYVFDQDDFKYFSHKGCWTGKSKRDYTIFNILKVFGNPPPKLKDVIDFYDNKTYHDLFQNAKDNWDKVKKLLTYN